MVHILKDWYDDAQHFDILTIIFPIKTFQKQLKVL